MTDNSPPNADKPTRPGATPEDWDAAELMRRSGPNLFAIPDGPPGSAGAALPNENAQLLGVTGDAAPSAVRGTPDPAPSIMFRTPNVDPPKTPTPLTAEERVAAQQSDEMETLLWIGSVRKEIDAVYKKHRDEPAAQRLAIAKQAVARCHKQQPAAIRRLMWWPDLPSSRLACLLGEVAASIEGRLTPHSLRTHTAKPDQEPDHASAEPGQQDHRDGVEFVASGDWHDGMCKEILAKLHQMNSDEPVATVVDFTAPRQAAPSFEFSAKCMLAGIAHTLLRLLEPTDKLPAPAAARETEGTPDDRGTDAGAVVPSGTREQGSFCP